MQTSNILFHIFNGTCVRRFTKICCARGRPRGRKCVLFSSNAPTGPRWRSPWRLLFSLLILFWFCDDDRPARTLYTWIFIRNLMLLSGIHPTSAFSFNCKVKAIKQYFSWQMAYVFHFCACLKAVYTQMYFIFGVTVFARQLTSPSKTSPSCAPSYSVWLK